MTGPHDRRQRCGQPQGSVTRPPLLPALLVMALLAFSAPVRAAPPDLAWVSPKELRLVELGHRSPSETLEPVKDPSGPVVVGRGRALLIPAEKGATLRVEGTGLEIGVGTGHGSIPDAIVWQQSPDAGLHEVRIPTWGTAQFLVVRGLDGASAAARVRVAARRQDPLLWFRADAKVANWLSEPNLPLPELPSPLEDARALLTTLAATRAVFAEHPQDRAVRHLLLARWLAGSARYRPMTAPFFTRANVDLEGAASNPAAAPELGTTGGGRSQRVLAKGGALLVSGDALDVVTLRIETRADRGSLVRVYEGDALAAEIRTDIARQARSQDRWTPPRMVRVIPARGRVRLVAAAGTVRVTASGYQQRNTAGAPLLRERGRLLRRAAAAGSNRDATLPQRVVAAVAIAEMERTTERTAALIALAREPSTPTPLRALLLHEAIRHNADPANTGSHLADLAAATTGLSAEISLPLRLSALERVAELSGGSAASLPYEVLARFLADEEESSEAALLRLYVELLHPPRDRRRSLTAARAEGALADTAGSPVALRRASQAWRRIAPWSNLPPADGTPTISRFGEVFAEPDTDGKCTFDGSAGSRWFALGPADDITVADRGGSHVRVRLLADPGHDPTDSAVRLEDVTVAVHGGAGLGTSVAVRPGERRLSLLSGAPVLAKFPSTAHVDCKRLRDELKWALVRNSTVFALPEGAALTAASLVVAAESLVEPTELEVTVGAQRFRGWVRPPGTGALELPIPPHATTLQVDTSAPLMVRVLARMHRWPRASQRPFPASPAAPPEEAELLFQLRQSTRALRNATTAAARIDAWTVRAEALSSLGYRTLADADRARIRAGGGHADDSVPSTPAAPLAMDLPPGSASVVPIGSLPLIPPLPLPADPASLRQALAEGARGADDSQMLAWLMPSASSSAAIDALLLAVLASRVGKPAVAADAYRRIALAHDAPRAMTLASAALADAALESQELSMVMEAYLLAREAAKRDPGAAGVLARLSDAIEWVPVDPDKATGSVSLDISRHADFDALPLGARVRRALLDAPSYAVLTVGDPVITPVRSGTSYRVDTTCHTLDGPDEGCPMSVTVDGKPTLCLPLLAATPTLPSEGGTAPELGLVGSRAAVANEVSCRVTVAERGGRLVVSPPVERRIVGAVSVRAETERGLDAITLRTRWTEARPDTPYGVLVRGPLVLKITARGEGDRPQLLQPSVDAATGARTFPTLPLPTKVDAHARRQPGNQKVGSASTTYLVLKEPGPQWVWLTPNQGRAFLRVQHALAIDLPRTSRAATSTPDPPLLYSVPAGLPAASLPPVGWDPTPGLLSLGAGIVFTVADLSDSDIDPRRDYLELRLSAQRRLDSSAIWLRLSLLNRLREGPATFGLETRVGVGPASRLPGGFALGRVLWQRYPTTTGMGALGLLGTYYPLRLGRNTSFVPNGTLTVRVVDERVARAGDEDPGIFSPYAAATPASLDVGARLDHRLLLDLRGRAGSQLRLLPASTVVDRIDGLAQLLLFGRPGLPPELAFEVRVSQRPLTEARSAPFTRLLARGDLGLFAWGSDSSRFNLDGSLTWYVDLPLELERSALTGLLGLGYTHVARRGVRDLDPGERSFPAMQEGQHTPPARVTPRGHPYWSPTR